MKKLLLVILMMLYTAEAGADDNILEDVAQQTEQIQKECRQQAYTVTSNTSLADHNFTPKEHKKYNQCLKKAIIKQIRQTADKYYADKMVASLEDIETGILDFYRNLYNPAQNVSADQLQNDIALKRNLNEILNDIIHFRHVYNQ